MLARWSTSRVGVARSVYQGLRRLVLAVYYSQPESFADIGYLGPLHERALAFPWEGPAPDVAAPNADEPVARGARTARTPVAAPAPITSSHSALRHPATSSVRLSADVVVIGSGAGGAVAATRLAEAGRDVLLIEEGNLVD